MYSINSIQKPANRRLQVSLGLVWLAACSTAVQAGEAGQLQVYGFLKANLEQVQTAGPAAPGPLRRVSNDLSVLGFRASEDLGGALSVWAQIETNVKVDTGEGPWGGRNTGIGLRGPWGEWLLGQWETPLRFVSVYAVDPFTAGIFASNSIMGNGFVTAGNGASPSSFDRRAPNLLQYSSPSWASTSFKLAYALPEEKSPSLSPDLISALLSHVQGPLMLALGHERHRDYFHAGSQDWATRLGASYSWGSLRLRGAWERLHYQPQPGKTLERDAWQLALSVDSSSGQWRASYVRGERARGNASVGVGGIAAPTLSNKDGSTAQQVSLGYGHRLSARSELWVAWTQLSNGESARYNLAANPVPGLQAGQSPRGLGLGMTHKF
ncbi:porin [Paucibacter sp. Y2R2-4]|uniref:porin n=1 Tax=Paucibacter sp. Y2R2-4 TaxID=2893553 RepID=UPI0021E4640E|nr:porin [Paucibacter sp. Y2R2-4]MCV2350231.1 porin [Paucibacter sp. Y2R2-4]